MAAKKTVKATGTLALWELRFTRFDQKQTKQTFAAHGLGKYAPNPRTKLACLSHAVTRLYGTRSTGTAEARTIEPCGREGYVVNVAKPDPTTHRVGTEHLIAAWLETVETPDGKTQVMRTDGDIAEWERIDAAMKEYEATIDGSAVSKALVEALCSPSIKGTPLKSDGGVYWLPETSAEKWLTLSADIERCAVSGGAWCWAITTVGDEQSVRAVADAFLREMEKEIAATEALLVDPSAKHDELMKRAEAMSESNLHAEKLEEILDTSLAALRERLDNARVRAGQAAALVL